MSDKQLTVAELLARSGGSDDSSKTPRRRRRRSLEEGGISVAELTGNIPKVASKPTESRHSNVPIDAEHDNRPDAEPTTSQDPLDVDRDTSAEEQQPSPLGVEQSEVPTDDQSDVVSQPLGAQPKEDPEEDHDAPLAVDVPDEDAEADATDVPASQEASKESDISLAVVDEKDPVQLTTGSFPAQAVPQASAEEALEEPTPAFDKEYEEHFDQPAPEQPLQEEPELLQQRLGTDAEETTVIKEVREPVRPQHDAEDTNVIRQVQEDVEEEELDDEALAAAYDEEAAANEKISIGAVILMALVGIVLGAVIFFGFQMLWGSMNKWLVSVLALAVTGAMVGVVHALRTASDKFSMGLSALVGLVLTFGPALIV
ncbi:hypothetical protein [Corynebacterium pseudopelargi]|uniref:Uncharacterized protein n=1 Tax=Corynebacterium pseudopelargi TaxID=2080757 RepID=A0A3G6IWV1_9CORY|nr:hypothetical protein [Corynebacterium pseudopelargi]AZA10126.1 hypothetical protein CPPEL_10135 [Corynebacterium pseudopelargi]